MCETTRAPQGFQTTGFVLFGLTSSVENTKTSWVSPAWDAVSSPGDAYDVFSSHDGVIITLKHPVFHLQNLHRLLQALWIQNKNITHNQCCSLCKVKVRFKPNYTIKNEGKTDSWYVFLAPYSVPSRWLWALRCRLL